MVVVEKKPAPQAVARRRRATRTRATVQRRPLRHARGAPARTEALARARGAVAGDATASAVAVGGVAASAAHWPEPRPTAGALNLGQRAVASAPGPPAAARTGRAGRLGDTGLVVARGARCAGATRWPARPASSACARPARRRRARPRTGAGRRPRGGRVRARSTRCARSPPPQPGTKTTRTSAHEHGGDPGRAGGHPTGARRARARVADVAGARVAATRGVRVARRAGQGEPVAGRVARPRLRGAARLVCARAGRVGPATHVGVPLMGLSAM